MTTQLFISCKSDHRKINFSEFKLIFENEIVHKVTNEGNLFDKENLIAKIHGEQGIIRDSKGKILIQFKNDDILDVEGDFLFTINEKGEGRRGSMICKWSKEGEFMMNEKKTGIRIEPINRESYQLASILLFLHS